MTNPNGLDSLRAAGRPRYVPAALHAIWNLWSACPAGLRRALQCTGIPYVVGFVARYRRSHDMANFAGALPELQAAHKAGRWDAVLSARFDAIVDQLIMPNGVSKTTYFRRQEEILAKVLAHEACRLHKRAIRVLDLPSSAGTDSLRNHAMLATRHSIATYVLGDLYFDILYDPRRRCVFDEEGNLLQVGGRRRFFSIYRAHTSGEVYTWLTRVLLLPLDLYASWLKKRYRYSTQGHNVRIRVIHPEVEAKLSEGTLDFARMDVFRSIAGVYDLILSFNLLQRNYFPPDRIAAGLDNVARALDEDGVLVVGNSDSFVAMRKRRGQLIPVVHEGAPL